MFLFDTNTLMYDLLTISLLEDKKYKISDMKLFSLRAHSIINSMAQQDQIKD